MIITLCGSARFEDEFHHWNEYFTITHECMVYSLSVFPSFKGNKTWYTPATKTVLDRVHKRKIMVSDAIFVITQLHSDLQQAHPAGAYIGDSTTREIEFAYAMGKRVFYDFGLEETDKAIHAHKVARLDLLL